MSKSMKINIVNVNKEIEIYGLQEVTSLSYFVSNSSEPHPEGLFSIDIFGNPGTSERKKTWAYVKLNDYFMNPHVFYVFSRLRKAVANDMKQGLGRYYIDHTGELTKLDTDKTVPETAIVKDVGTGFDWLHEHWTKISWRVDKTMSKAAKNNRGFLRMLDVEQVFMDKCLIMPAFYRDVDYKSTKRNKINTFYIKIMRLASLIKNTSGILFYDDDPDVPVVSTSHVKMQTELSELYKFFMDKLGGANGFINKHVVGKSTDYGARLVISTPDFNSEHYTDCEVDFFRTSTPLSVAMNIFAPFVIYGLNTWIKNKVSGHNYLRYYDKTKKELTSRDLDPTWLDEFSGDNIRKTMDLYKKSKKFRVEPFTLKGVDGTRIPITVFFKVVGENTVLSTDINDVIEIDEKDLDKHTRYMTNCEMYYIICMNYISDKPIFNTRYPITTHNSTYSSLMNIIPSNNYATVLFNGESYKRYPVLKYKTESEIEHIFTDSLRMHSVYPDVMGADFDGDQIYTQGVFSNEGKEECMTHMKEVSNVLGIDGNVMRNLPQVVKHGLYGLTYKIPKPIGSN